MPSRQHFNPRAGDKINSATFRSRRADIIFQHQYQGSQRTSVVEDIVFNVEGLSGSLDEQQPQLDDLRAAAEPLAASCAPEVGRRVQAAVTQAVTAWEETSGSLRVLCERYEEAARLWRQYREASDAVQQWVDRQLEGAARLPADEALHQVEVCEQTLSAHLAELQALAARVATEAGLDGPGPLGPEVAALGRRLDDVRESLTALAQAAESSADLRSARCFLASVQQSLSAVEDSTDKDAEKQLCALRNHLLALGKTESQLQTLREKGLELGPTKSETSVVQILQLWQQVFRETFQQYHRLSARLVRGQDGAAALRLWQEYLAHVGAFLSGELPQDQLGLAEHERLCEVHQSLLSSHPALEPALAEQITSLTNLHNETLASMMERHTEVRTRLARWEKYREVSARLLSWLRDAERDKHRLQLRFLHLRRLPAVGSRLNTLLERLPAGEAMLLELSALQPALLAHCDEALTSSIRLEYGAASQGVANLRAGLETWRDHVGRVAGLARHCEEHSTTLGTTLAEVRAAATPGVTEEQLEQLRSCLAAAAPQLEELSADTDQLKETLSPGDGKAVTQRVWLLWQAHADLEHTVAMLTQQLEEQRGRGTHFHARSARFLRWAADLEARIDRGASEEPEDVLRRLETELPVVVASKECEAVWLMQEGVDLGEEARVAEVAAFWDRVQTLGHTRAAKLRQILDTKAQLEARIAELRAWLHKLEAQLTAPVVFEEISQQIADKRLGEVEALQKSVEKQSSNIASVLNLSELLLTDCEASKAAFNTEPVLVSTEVLERRWKGVCSTLDDRKKRIMALWTLLQQIHMSCSEHGPWLAEQQAKLTQEDGDARSLVARVEGVLQELDAQRPALHILEQANSRLAKAGPQPEAVAGPLRDTLARWHSLGPAAAAALQALRRRLELEQRFVAAHGAAVVSLAQLDVRLTQLQHLSSPPDARDRMRQLDALGAELATQGVLLAAADELGLAVMREVPPSELGQLQRLVDEYQSLWSDLDRRLSTLRALCQEELTAAKEVVSEVDSAVQVETLRFEQDSAVQVDTLGQLTSSDAYRYELQIALRECSENLDALEELLLAQDTTSQPLSKAVALCQSSVELVQHLSQLLLQDECDMSRDQTQAREVAALATRFEGLLGQARTREQRLREINDSARLTCPLCSRRNWQQLENDLWRLEQWLQYAEGTQRGQDTLPSNIEQLEDVIQDHREFLMDLDSHKSLVVSLNIVGTHLADHTEDEERAVQMRARLESTNRRWEAVCRTAAAWQTRLQTSLMGNHQFHETIEELVEWVDRTEATIRQAEPVDLSDDITVVEAKYSRFRELRGDLERCEPRVMSLQEAANQLLRNEDDDSTWSRLTDLRLKLQSLRRLTGVYVLKLGAVLGRDPSELSVPVVSSTYTSMAPSLASLTQLSDQGAVGHVEGSEQLHTNSDDEVDTSVLARGYRFLGRVVRASLPIQALMLLLLGVASLVPTSEDDYSCVLSNNFARSLEPMLRYPNGPPPI